MAQGRHIHKTRVALGALTLLPSLAQRPAPARAETLPESAIHLNLESNPPATACAPDPHYNPQAAEVPDIMALEANMGNWLKAPCDYSPSIITYAFDETSGNHVEIKPEGTTNKAHDIHTWPLTPAQREQLLLAFREYERVLNVKFIPFDPARPNTGNIELTERNRGKPILNFRNADIGTINYAGEGCFPNLEDGFAHYIEFDPDIINGSAILGSESFRDMLHELDHCVGGKKHPGQRIDTNGLTLEPGKDTQAASVLSERLADGSNPWDQAVFRRYGNDKEPASDGHAPSTLMPLDILALQGTIAHDGPLKGQLLGFGANWDYRLPDSTAKLTGEQKVWALWNGSEPAVIDAASSYKGTATVTINLNPGTPLTPADATHAGDEYLFIAYGPGVNKAIGAKNADNRFIGNLRGGGSFIGGGENNRYELYGKHNDVTAGAGPNRIVLHEGTDVVVHGFDPKRDRIEIDGRSLTALREERDNHVRLLFQTEKGDYASVQFETIPLKAEIVATTAAGKNISVSPPLASGFAVGRPPADAKWSGKLLLAPSFRGHATGTPLSR